MDVQDWLDKVYDRNCLTNSQEVYNYMCHTGFPSLFNKRFLQKIPKELLHPSNNFLCFSILHYQAVCLNIFTVLFSLMSKSLVKKIQLQNGHLEIFRSERCFQNIKSVICVAFVLKLIDICHMSTISRCDIVNDNTIIDILPVSNIFKLIYIR